MEDFSRIEPVWTLRQDYVYPDAKDRQFLRYFYKGAKKKQFNVEKYNKLKNELEQVTQLLYLRLTISEFKSHSQLNIVICFQVEEDLRRLKYPNQLQLPLEQIQAKPWETPGWKDCQRQMFVLMMMPYFYLKIYKSAFLMLMPYCTPNKFTNIDN